MAVHASTGSTKRSAVRLGRGAVGAPPLGSSLSTTVARAPWACARAAWLGVGSNGESQWSTRGGRERNRQGAECLLCPRRGILRSLPPQHRHLATQRRRPGRCRQTLRHPGATTHAHRCHRRAPPLPSADHIQPNAIVMNWPLVLPVLSMLLKAAQAHEGCRGLAITGSTEVQGLAVTL